MREEDVPNVLQDVSIAIKIIIKYASNVLMEPFWMELFVQVVTNLAWHVQQAPIPVNHADLAHTITLQQKIVLIVLSKTVSNALI